MYKQQKYSGVKPVYHNRETGLTTYERIDRHQTCFDSTAEFKAYILLEESFDSKIFHVDVHPEITVNGSKWKVDFAITANESNKIARPLLAKIINTVQSTQHLELSKIYVEYKGFQDKNFIQKMTNVAIEAPIFAKSVILVSEHNSAFGCYDNIRQRFYCHPIVSMALLKGILEKTLLQKD